MAGRCVVACLLLVVLALFGDAQDVADDGELVLVEDISDPDNDLARSYPRMAAGSADDLRAPASPSSPFSPSSSASPSAGQRAKRRRSDAPSLASVTAAMADVQQRLDSLATATRDYATALFDGEHVETMAKLQQEAQATVSQAITEASQGAKTDGATFRPILDQLAPLQREAQRAKTPLAAQLALHLELMARTQDVLSHLDPKANKALRAYVNQRLKKRKPSSRENLLEMQNLQRTMRQRWWLGATTRELRGVVAMSLAAFLIYGVLKIAAYRFLILRFPSPVVDFAVAIGCLLSAYYAGIGSAAAYASLRNVAAQGAALLAGAAGCAALQEQAEGLLVRPAARRRVGRRLRD